MATLQVRDINDGLYESLKINAVHEHRSLSQQVAKILEESISSSHLSAYAATQEFLSLNGSWHEEGSANEIIETIQSHRKKSPRFGAENVVFD